MNCIDCSYSLTKDGHCNCTYEEGECIKINVLKKENTELKKHHKSVCDTLTNTHRHIRKQLTQAKEIIAELLNNFAYPIGREDWTVEDADTVSEAEQFLKEIK